MSALSLDPAAASTREILKIALLRARRGWRLGASTAGFIAHQIGEAAIPILIGVIIDQAIVRRDGGALLLWLGVLAATFIVLSMSYQRAMLGMVRVYGHGEHDLRQLATARVLHPRGRSTYRRVGDVLSVTSSDTYRLAGVAWSIVEQGATVAALLTASIALLVISLPLGVGVLLGAVAVLLGMQILARPLERLGMIEQSSVAAASDVATDTMSGLRIVRGLGAEDEVIRRYRTASAASLRGAVTSARRLLTYNAVSETVSILYLGILACTAAWMASRGDITVGQLVTVVALGQFLQGSLSHIGTFGANWAHKRASARRLHTLIADPYPLPSGGISSPTQAPAVLRWARPANETSAASTILEVRPGELLGVHVDGASAARSVAAVLSLRTPPQPGELFLHGVDALDIGPESYRRAVAAPPHDATVFSGSLGDNVIGHGSNDTGGAEWDPAIAQAVALDDVVDHVGSPDMPVGEGGARLSGGQRQRVLLGRALHSRCSVIILDEPTTALDPLTEQQVARGLRNSGLGSSGLGSSALGSSGFSADSRSIVVITSSEILLSECHRVVHLAADAGTAPVDVKSAPPALQEQ